MIGTCRHCGAERTLRPRRLCFPCYDNLEIRAAYPVVSKYATVVHKEGHEPTEEELERMIQEQLPTMPDTIALPPRQTLPQIVRRTLLARRVR